MRILMMLDAPPRADSGAAGTEMQTAAALRRLGHEVDEVWTALLPRRIAHGNLRYLLELPRVYRREMLRRLSHGSYDVVHANQPHGYLAARALRSITAPPVFVHRSHGFEPRVRAALERHGGEYGRGRLQRLASGVLGQALHHVNERGIARWADGHIVSSSLCASWLRDRMGVPGDRLAVIAQAAPAGFLQAPAHALDAGRVDRLLYVAQFTPFKAPDITAQAFASIVARNPRSRLTWVCDAQHHSAAAALLSPAARERTTFAPWMKQDELLPVYDAHGVFLFPSYFEGFGKASLEAMSRGLVVVASDEGGAHDIIASGVNGWRTPVGDAAHVADAVLAAQSDPTLAAKMGQAARETALAYTWDRTAAETADFYSRLLAPGRR